MKIQIFTFIGILYVLLQIWFFNISSLGWRLNTSWVIITTILFTLIINYANATINYYKDKGEKKMTKQDLIKDYEFRIKNLRRKIIDLTTEVELMEVFIRNLEELE